MIEDVGNEIHRVLLASANGEHFAVPDRVGFRGQDICTHRIANVRKVAALLAIADKSSKVDQRVSDV